MFRALLDSGACRTYIGHSVSEWMNLYHAKPIEFVGEKTCLSDGSELTLNQKYNVEMAIGGKSYKHLCLLMEDMVLDILIV